MARDEGEDERLHGVSLAQLAAVHAALAEPFPIRRVLALEGIEGPVFRQAEEAWRQRMAADWVTAARYQAHLAAAEDRLVRVVTPLHKDAEAWALFQASYQAHPAEILRSADLGGNDVARLQRFWTRQMDADAELKARLQAILGRGPRGLPEITAAPRELRPSPEARGTALPATPPAPGPEAPAPAAADAEGLDVYVELTLDLEASPGDEARILARYGLPSDDARAALVRRWEARFQEDPSLRRDFRTLTAHRRTQRDGARAQRDGVRPRPSSSPPPRSYPDPAPYSLPVTPTPPPMEIPAAEPLSARPPLAAPIPPAAPAAQETMDVARLLARGPALPFHEGAPVSLPPPEDRPPPSHRAEGDAGGTMDVAQLLSGPALPFPGAKATRSQPPEERAPPSHPTGGDAGGTMDVAQLLAGPALPFHERARAPDPPSLSIEQYASLSVDMLLDPARSAETLARYRLTEPQWDTLTAAWSARFARDPAARDSFGQALATYRAWLSRQRR